MSEQQDLISALKQLASKIKKEVDDGRSTGLIQPDEELYQRWKVDKFRYTEGGVAESSVHSEYMTKKMWFRAFFKINELIKKSDEYSSALKLLIKTAGREDKIVQDLDRFTEKFVHRYLEDLKFSDADEDIFISIFLKDIKEEPLKYGAHVELDGIVILPERIEFKIEDTNILLRQTTIEDLEKEFPVYGVATQPFLERPSAILHIEFLGRQANEIQIKVEQMITILRLFKVGSIKYISYHMHSESITDALASGVLTVGKSVGALEKSHITEKDTRRLKKFWQTIIETLPPSFFGFEQKKIDYITIAYNRYCDALLQNGVIERRIANAVMGLEGLFLKGGETQELVYRLSIRVAKIFSLLRYDTDKVKEIVKDAYKVRSLFVHGDHLSYKEKIKLNNKYGDIKSLLFPLLDSLRVSIIIMIFMNKGKEEFLDFIDDSLIDRDKDGQLDSLLNAVRNRVGDVV